MTYPILFQGDKVTVVIGTKPHTISKSHFMYNKLVQAIKDQDWELVKNIIEPKKIVLNFGNGNIEIEDQKIFWKGIEMHNALTKRMIQMIQEDFPVEPLVNFMENLMQNPSKRAVNELYGFLENNNLPITPDGHFLAYKKVRQDYYDVHSGTVLNKPAVYMTDEDRKVIAETTDKQSVVKVAVENGVTVVSMERNMVDDDQNKTCSVGLHFCSREYLDYFGGSRIIILKINPRDVVSIPNDHNESKGRCCRYEIVDEIDKDKADEAFAKAVQEKANSEVSVITPEKIAEALTQLLENYK
jgi:hypothetical protein